MVNPAGAIYHYLFATLFGKSAILYEKSPFSIVQILLPRPNLPALIANADRAGWGHDGCHRLAVALAGRITRYFEGAGVFLGLAEGDRPCVTTVAQHHMVFSDFGDLNRPK